MSSAGTGETIARFATRRDYLSDTRNATCLLRGMRAERKR